MICVACWRGDHRDCAFHNGGGPCDCQDSLTACDPKGVPWAPEGDDAPFPTDDDYIPEDALPCSGPSSS